MMIFADVLEIRNGRNQRAVEDPNGAYPIYGSGGIMGYADDFICQAQTVVVGRKGNINKPLFVDVPFWNVDTAFGLEAKRNVLLPKYLYYFCLRYDFERLNKAVTIPSLTKTDLLKIEIELPNLSVQKGIVSRLESIERIISIRQRQLCAFDTLIKARFVELFGDPICNEKNFDMKPGLEVFKLSNGKFVPESKRRISGIPVYGGNGISWYTDESLFDSNTIVIGRVGFQSGNVHLAKGPLWISDNAMYISDLYDEGYDLQFLFAVMEHIDFSRYQDAGDLKKITQKPFMQMEYIKPPLKMQREYNTFVSRIDKSKVVVQAALDKAQLLFNSLMQQYFG